MEVLGEIQPPRRRRLDAGKVLGLVRIDAPEGGKGKPCGKAHIPKSYKCGKTNNTTNQSNEIVKLRTVAAAAGLTVAGAVALGVITRKYRPRITAGQSTTLNQSSVKALTPAAVRRTKRLKGSQDTTLLLPERSSRPSNRQLRNIDEYVNGSAQLNKALREGRVTDIDMDQVKAIDAWMSNSTPVQGRFWRGVSSETSYEQLSRLRVGDTFTDSGYGSFTSDLFTTARSFATVRPTSKDQSFILKINGSLYPLPYDHMANYDARKAARYSGKLVYNNNTAGMMDHEKELLSPRNSQFKITKIIPDVELSGRIITKGYKPKYTIIEADLIPQQVTSAQRSVRGSSVAPLGLRRKRRTRLQDDNPLLNSSIAGDYEWDDDWED